MALCQKETISKRIKSLYDLFHLKQQIRDYTRIVSKINGDGKTVATKRLVDDFSANREKYNLKTEIIMSGMVDYCLIIANSKVNAWRILLRSERIVKTWFMNKHDKADFLSYLVPINWM